MEQRFCKKSYPTSVLKLYIKLFCKRRKSSKYKMMEAIKSWVSLDKIEREQFFIKFKECQSNHKKKLADYLSKTKPFLKKKEQSRAVRNASTKQKSKIMEIDNNNQINNEETINNDQITGIQSIDDNSQFPSEIDLPEKTQINNEETINNDQITGIQSIDDNSQFPSEIDLPEKTQINNEETINNDQITGIQSIDDNSQFPSEIDLPDKTHCDFYECSDSPKNNSCFVAEQPLDGVLTEPAPPSAICAKDLFAMIKSRNGESIDTWSSLSSTQKSRYRKAVFLIKEEYIRKFKAYLESLPAKKLFDYYNDYCN